jgi:hypothetical protein
LASLVTLLWLALKMTGILGVIGSDRPASASDCFLPDVSAAIGKHGNPTLRVLKGPRSAESEIVTGGCSF